MIRPFALSELAAVTQGVLSGSDVDIEKVSTDSRDCASALFFALRGERFDAHDFLEDAYDNDCAALVVEGSVAQLPERVAQGCSVLKVTNTKAALGYAGALNRKAFKGRVIGLTGSSGKTTTKNMLLSILSVNASVTATQSNFNNEVGVPLTLLDIDADSDFAVVEMGARHIGDIRYLGDFVSPDIALVLNAGSAHLGEFGSYEAIVKTKGELYQTLSEGGIAVFNLDDPAVSTWRACAGKHRGFAFSLERAEADLLARAIDCSAEGSRFELVYQDEVQSVSLSVPGRHNVANAVAAASVALMCEMSLADIAKGLAAFNSGSGRLDRIELPCGASVFDDSYNANPASVKASLEVLKLQPGHQIAVLGEMGELGEESLRHHLNVAEYAKALNISELYTCGRYANDMVATFGDGARAFASRDELALELSKRVKAGDMLLIKGSRTAGMEQVVVTLKGDVH